MADYVSLMIYPSHYEQGNIPVDGHPNDFPAETVTYTLEQSQQWVPGTMKKMRPWLQDFTYPLEGYSEYGPAEVRDQIDAAEAHGRERLAPLERGRRIRGFRPVPRVIQARSTRVDRRLSIDSQPGIRGS